MMSGWILGILLVTVFMIGFLLGMRFMIIGFKKAIEDPDSPIRHLLDQEAEGFARIAEKQDDKSHCLHCGEDVAGRIRAYVKAREVR